MIKTLNLLSKFPLVLRQHKWKLWSWIYSGDECVQQVNGSKNLSASNNIGGNLHAQYILYMNTTRTLYTLLSLVLCRIERIRNLILQWNSYDNLRQWAKTLSLETMRDCTKLSEQFNNWRLLSSLRRMARLSRLSILSIWRLKPYIVYQCIVY